jgi:hypothetical protein
LNVTAYGSSVFHPRFHRRGERERWKIKRPDARVMGLCAQRAS